MVATAYFVRSADLLAQSAAVLGRGAEAESIGIWPPGAGGVCPQLCHAYGGVVSDATTAYALALAFALLPSDEQRQFAGERLAALVRSSGFRISTGFVGTPLVCDALCAAGAPVAAYRLLLQRMCPSWLYSVTMGATTIWERWDSMLPNGDINPGEMTSL